MTRITIENMIGPFPVNDRNRAEYNMCREMLADPEAFQLVFFHLPASESTHLKYAILNRWKDHVSLLYAPVSAFTDDLVAAIENGGSPFAMSEYVKPEVQKYPIHARFEVSYFKQFLEKISEIFFHCRIYS